MTTSNPSHLLLNRNPRSPAHPQLVQTALYAPSPTPGPAAHLFSYGSPPPSEIHHARSQSTPALSFPDTGSECGDDDVVVHPTFWSDATFPGRVKVVVGRHEFWCHKEVLWFASPFFSACLQGSWAETEVAEPRFPAASADDGRPDSMQMDPPEEREEAGHEGETEGKTSVYLDAVDHGVADIMRELRELPDPRGDALETLVEGESLRRAERASEAGEEVKAPAKDEKELAVPAEGEKEEATQETAKTPVEHKRRSKESPTKLELDLARHAKRTSASSLNLARRRTHSAGRERRRHERHDALIELPEDSPAAFQDFLFWAYPHLECKVTWTNVARLLALSSKLIVPALQAQCERFLLTHASGRPIEALALAEKHENSELYREASRFVLDQASWDPDEFESLSEQTQIKLSRRRMWFLERLLKLGTIDVKKEYVCRPDCPDQSRCQAQLDEKWRQAHTAVSRYGPPQPSVAFRCLRQLEGFPTNPALIMQHPLCQSSAKSWVASLFDRMFQLKAISARTPGTEKYWMFITMN
ncbi:hypothetical protein CC85DRAFT_117288 [Cutaneotrichosporon oleaginosum]|uniref:BTB domain-containing protein n=1 Tax=Cutaneotrichosporon oleaginosum TaxID=879819 RepID=A0A0J0XXJ9_9TREE|nr:uncharacterized protein CC85DRAFT_117288 [Cutaneotrichosporon oleaginosum]KLT45781.1 hypothetical protein CC85DRAFT_117288 [Cutaneotrichosporon oleaginosum]TXT04456.1 hypothetical protein COLE_07275 [Cutaneotrichosporon oleaginosum]